MVDGLSTWSYKYFTCYFHSLNHVEMHKMHAIVQLTIYVHSIKVSALLDCLVSTYCLPEVINYICSSRHIIHPAEAVVSILSDLLSYFSPNWT